MAAPVDITYDKDFISVNGIQIPLLSENSDATSVTAVQRAIANIRLDSDTVGTFFNVDEGKYFDTGILAKPDTQNALKVLLKDLKAVSSDKIKNFDLQTPEDGDRFKNVVATTALITSILTKVYIAMVVTRSSQPLPTNANSANIDKEIDNMKQLLKSTFSLVMKIDSFNDYTKVD